MIGPVSQSGQEDSRGERYGSGEQDDGQIVFATSLAMVRRGIQQCSGDGCTCEVAHRLGSLSGRFCIRYEPTQPVMASERVVWTGELRKSCAMADEVMEK
jgi:hypothetical protein